jgi:hypothetical protein
VAAASALKSSLLRLKAYLLTEKVSWLGELSANESAPTLMVAEGAIPRVAEKQPVSHPSLKLKKHTSPGMRKKKTFSITDGIKTNGLGALAFDPDWVDLRSGTLT